MRVIEQHTIFADVGYHGPEGMRSLTQKLDDVLSHFSIIDHANGVIYHGEKSVTIKADLSSKNLLRYFWSQLRRVRDYLKPKDQRYSDLKIDVIVDDNYAEVNLHDPKKWKEPIHDAVFNALKSKKE
jgi:ribosomal protein S15P/S13E